ncbi:hypothetical protein C7374_105178 [Falsochrobactrum ovis]|uniref:Uncharacterized protein n=1 Tax=Falsochrobactrum ovis TaxID=1293442 RepID=A0A364JTG7_9HYPH|nr:hypothetical protein C7374_11170 [Falsochrobactrum ovis]RAK29127.1 hypothetical protein C7374_105178 [Falsochrobactrum ovis]
MNWLETFIIAAGAVLVAASLISLISLYFAWSVM